VQSSQIDIDEPFTIYWAQADLKELFGLFKDENNPPAFFLMLHFWIKIFGTSIISVRFLPTLFASLAVIFIYRIGNRFFNNYVAIVASLIYTFSNIVTYHAHDVRVYSLFILLSVASIYYFLRLIENPSDKKSLCWWIFVNIALTYSHFYGFILVFYEFGFLLLNRNIRIKLVKSFFIMAGCMILAYLPYLKIILERFISAKGGTWVSKPDFQAPYFRIVEFSNQPLTAVFFLIIIILGIFLAIKNKSKIKSIEWVVFLWFLVPFVFMYLVSFKIPMFIPKYMVYMLPGYYLTLSIFLTRITEKLPKIRLALAVIAIVLMAVTSRPAEGNNRQPKETAEFVKSKLNDSTLVFLCPPWIDLNFSYYYNINIFNDFGNVRHRLNEEKIYAVYNFKEQQNLLLESAKSVVFVDAWSELTDPEGTIINKLRTNYSKEEITEFKGYTIFYFSQRKP
jgi:uncharacterized membrane protein